MLPTMQKAVVNALASCGIVNDPDGMRKIYMDNHYLALELFLMLREKYKILACGTIHQNWMGHKSHEPLKIISLKNILGKV